MVQEREKVRPSTSLRCGRNDNSCFPRGCWGDDYQLGNNAATCLGVCGDFFGDAGFVSGEHDAEAVGYALMPLATSGYGDAAVNHFAIKPVGEDVEG